MTGTQLTALADLSRELGDPRRELVILAEGNTAVANGDGTFWVKTSGSRMASAGEQDFVRLEAQPLLDLLAGPDLGEAELRSAFAGATREGAGRPSIEAILHAICLAEFGATVTAHTHPVGANGLLCSSRSRELVAGVLFPDQAVVCGSEAGYVEYQEPGVALAKAVRAAIVEATDRLGAAPRVVWLQNHGLLALGDSPAEALAVTEMADKFACVLSAVLSLGEPRWLSDKQVRKLIARDDEIDRRSRLVTE